ncbi:MAG: hypothetical protein ACRCZ0_11510 [Cetobacterium sp.]
METHFDEIMQEKYDKVFARIMVAVGKGTSYDTGVSRDIIKDILIELGRPELVGELDHIVYEFWRKRQDRLKDSRSHTLTKGANGRYHVTISDGGFNAQDVDGKVSQYHPRKDSRIVPHQIDNAVDLMETKLDPAIEEAFVELESYIVKVIEEGV